MSPPSDIDPRFGEYGDFLREVYGIFGIPVDAITLRTARDSIRAAVDDRRPFLLSTPNLNFLAQSGSSSAFRDSLLASDLCPPDGMPIVWLSRLLGAPVRHRVAGSDLFDSLKLEDGRRPMAIFLFGGPEGAAETACSNLNSKGGNLRCAGWLYPGFGNVASLSSDHMISDINTSGADFLSVSLGAEKGQAWLLENHARLEIPVRAHLGAAINFESGRVRRSPKLLGALGLEWLWRIKEEPHLLGRYWRDGLLLLKLLLIRTPLLLALWRFTGRGRGGGSLEILHRYDQNGAVVSLKGSCSAPHVKSVVPVFVEIVDRRSPVTIDLTDVDHIDARFIGLLLMLRKKVKPFGGIRLINASRRIRSIFSLNLFAWLLD